MYQCNGTDTSKETLDAVLGCMIVFDICLPSYFNPKYVDDRRAWSQFSSHEGVVNFRVERKDSRSIGRLPYTEIHICGVLRNESPANYSVNLSVTFQRREQ